MIKNRLKTLLLITSILTLPLMAANDSEESSLVGVDFGYSSFDAQRTSATNQITTKTYSLPNMGFKIGSQNRDYRVFLDAHYYSGNDFDYLTTYGVELDYMIHLSQEFNLFLGAGIGLANIKYTPQVATDMIRTLSDTYYSGTVGVNYKLTDSFDIDLGARYISFGTSNTKNSVKYTFDNLVSGYATVVYKFKMD